MRIVLINPIYPYRGGVAYQTTLLERSLRANNHEVLVISFQRQYPCWLYPGSSDQDPSKCTLRSEAEFLLDPIYPWTWYKTRQRIKEFFPHQVVFQWWTTFWAISFANLSAYCRRNRIHVAFILHNVQPHEQRLWDAWLVRSALQNGNTIIAQNPTEARRLLGGLIIATGLFLGLRFLYLNYILHSGTGLVQSVILAAALLIVGFQVLLIGLVADLIGFNRKILEEVLYRLRRMEIDQQNE